MGTRGLMAFAHNGEVKAMYNHWDSYPTGLGEAMVKWTLNQHGDFSGAIELFDRLEAVDESEAPTEDQKLALLRYMNLNVSTQSSDDWYSLLRETQGDPTEALKAGFFVDFFDFGKDSLFCEFAYVADLDRKVLEVYKGFVNEPHAEGRWAQGLDAEPTLIGASRDKYFPIRLLTTYPFADLTTDTMEALETKLDEEDE